MAYRTILQALQDFQRSYPVQFHLPSHSGRFMCSDFSSLLSSSNLMLLDGSRYSLEQVEDLELNGGKLRNLGSRFQTAFNSSLTLYSQNGSTMGNNVLAMCLAGKKVGIALNSHISIYNGLRIADCEIVQMKPDYDKNFDIYLPITKNQIQRILQEHSDIDAFYITSPSFDGLVSDYEAIKQACRDQILIVDEAHGAYTYYSNQMPKGSLLCGSDASVTSIHKTLGGICGTALINLGKNSKIDPLKVRQSYSLFATTTNSPLLMAQLESCTTNREHIQKILEKGIKLTEEIKQELQKLDAFVMGQFEGFQQLPTKIIFKVKGLSGKEIFEEYKKEGVVIEKYTQNSGILTVHPLINEEDVKKFVEASLKINKRQRERNNCSIAVQEVKYLNQREIAMNLQELFKQDFIEIKSKDSVNSISAQNHFSCPPGYPVLICGELIKEHHLPFLDETIVVVKQEAKKVFPISYYDKQVATNMIKKSLFQHLSNNLNLIEVQSPLFLKMNTGIQDNLFTGMTSLNFKHHQIKEKVEVPHSLAK